MDQYKILLLGGPPPPLLTDRLLRVSLKAKRSAWIRSHLISDEHRNIVLLNYRYTSLLSKLHTSPLRWGGVRKGKESISTSQILHLEYYVLN